MTINIGHYVFSRSRIMQFRNDEEEFNVGLAALDLHKQDSVSNARPVTSVQDANTQSSTIRTKDAVTESRRSVIRSSLLPAARFLIPVSSQR